MLKNYFAGKSCRFQFLFIHFVIIVGLHPDHVLIHAHDHARVHAQDRGASAVDQDHRREVDHAARHVTREKDLAARVDQIQRREVHADQNLDPHQDPAAGKMVNVL